MGHHRCTPTQESEFLQKNSPILGYFRIIFSKCLSTASRFLCFFLLVFSMFYFRTCIVILYRWREFSTDSVVLSSPGAIVPTCHTQYRVIRTFLSTRLDYVGWIPTSLTIGKTCLFMPAKEHIHARQGDELAIPNCNTWSETMSLVAIPVQGSADE